MIKSDNIFSQKSEAELEKVRAAIAILHQEKDGMIVLEDQREIGTDTMHPIDIRGLESNLRSFLKEIGLRKREIEPLAYVKWLRDKREEAITGMVSSHTNSPAHLLYEMVLPVLRAEIKDAESQDTEPKAASLQKDLTKLIVDGQLEAALEMAMIHAEKEAPDHLHDTIHLLSEYRHYEERERKGILDQQTISTARARIRDALLQLANLMKKN